MSDVGNRQVGLSICSTYCQQPDSAFGSRDTALESASTLLRNGRPSGPEAYMTEWRMACLTDHPIVQTWMNQGAIAQVHGKTVMIVWQD